MPDHHPIRIPARPSSAVFVPAAFAPAAILSAVLLVSAALMACTPSRKKLGNTYRGVLTSNLKNFDPALVQDQYSSMCQFQVYETLLEYKYLARPYDVQPCLAAAPVEISDSGKVYTIRMKRGVEFADDACFPGGKGREVKAADFVYSIKRMCDVRTKTTGWWIFDGKVEGLDAFRKATESLPPLAEQWHPALYDSIVPGLTALDDTTVRITLTRPYPYFKYILAMPYAAVVPHEAVDHYREDFQDHPVGTGPYLLKEWRRGLRVVFERNPKYHHGFYPSEGTAADSAEGLLADSGKALPFIDRIELGIFEEYQPMWLNFLRGNVDRSPIPKDNYGETVMPDKSVRGDMAAKGIALFRQNELDIRYTCFNFEDPLLGKHKALRQAMSLAYDAKKGMDLFYNGRGVHADSPIPPGLFGYDSTWKNPYARLDREAAKALLAKDGFPGGRGLPEFEYLTVAGSDTRQIGEFFAQCMARIGIRIKVATCTWPEFLERLKQRKIQIIHVAWGADYPDPENFLQLLYGPNESPGENNANYKNAEYDSLYREMAVMQDGPHRAAIIRRMQEILAGDCPWIYSLHRLNELLIYKWVANHRSHGVLDAPIKYYRIDAALRRALLPGAG
ncbi:MAG: ABC transporter substrate-binding protein [Fibrobacteria bacterium]